MKKLLLAASLLLPGLLANAQSLHGSQHPLTPCQQRLSARATTISASPSNARKGAGTQKERVKSVFVNYGSGDDSVVLYYGSPFRGSRYNYGMFDQLFGYDAGYSYLQNPGEWIMFDSLVYITRTDHVSPFVAYRKMYLQYPADSSGLESYARTDVPDAMHNYTMPGTAYRFDRSFAADGSLLHEYDYQYDAGLTQYDTSSVVRNDYYAPGAVLSSENYYFTTPYPNIGGGSRTVNYYTTGGKIYRADVLAFVPATNSYSAAPSTTLYTYNAAGKVASQTALTGAVTLRQDRYSYNSAGQKITDSLFNYKPGQFGGGAFNDTANTVFRYTYASATATDYATLLEKMQPAPGGINGGEPTHTIDSQVNTYDALGQVIHYQEVYDYDPTGAYPDVDSFNSFVTFGLPGKPVSYSAVDVYEGDTYYYNTALAFNSDNDPQSRATISSTDFGSTGSIDTGSVLMERYTYEHYSDPTAVVDIITAKKPSLKVYPNPATSELRFSCADMMAAQMTVTNSSGQIVRSHAVSLSVNEVVLPVSELAPGIYFIVLRDEADGKMATAKFVKQ